MSEHKQPTPADLERVAKWLGPEWRVGVGGEIDYTTDMDPASQWDVTGAIFDKLRDETVQIRVTLSKGVCPHAAALACAVKYLEGK